MKGDSRVLKCCFLRAQVVYVSKTLMNPSLLLLFFLHTAASQQILDINFLPCSTSSKFLRWPYGEIQVFPSSLSFLSQSLPLPTSNLTTEKWTRLTLYLQDSTVTLVLYRTDTEPTHLNLPVNSKEADTIRRAAFTLQSPVCAHAFTENVIPGSVCDCSDSSPFPVPLELPASVSQLQTRLRRAADACNPSPCLNSKPCSLNTSVPAGYTCQCSTTISRTGTNGVTKTLVTGWTGQNCSKDIDECLVKPCMNTAICQNHNGTFNCLCTRPGGFFYTGILCEKKIDQCRGQFPEFNITGNAPVCVRGNCSTTGVYPYFSCACPKGYTGRRCEIDINECAPKPCKNNATCTDLIAAYNCTCLPGFEGTNCEININECAPAPCLNGGVCTDLINAYSCNCSNTGFKGQNCSVNIDDCLPMPCQNNATCIDGIKDYNCTCHPGYTGKNCSVDINECSPNPCHFGSTCYQKSDQSLYGKPSMANIPPFNGTFDYNNAAGHVCKCVAGSKGPNCSINIDDCAPKPCANGATCVDLLNNYTCQCAPGYKGRNCSVEINECQLYKPCVNNATCVDLVANYSCTCQASPNAQGKVFGGRNCSVELVACRNNRCQGGARCVPYVMNETLHNYTCVCTAGRVGNLCQYDTSLTFSSTASLSLNLTVARNLSFDFRTTLNDTKIMSITGSSFSLSVVGGKISINTGVPQGTLLGLYSAPWITVSLVNATTLKIPAAGISLALSPYFNDSGNGLGTVKLGPSFTGCMRDVKADGIILQPDLNGTGLVTNNSVTAGCKRTHQCVPDPCGVGSRAVRCMDLWVNYRCLCVLGRDGTNCTGNTTLVTFGYNGVRTYLRYLVSAAAKKFIADGRGFSFQFLIQAWPAVSSKTDSMLAYFGVKNAETPLSYIVLLLTPSGHLSLYMKVSSVTVGSTTSTQIYNNTFNSMLVAHGAAQSIFVSLSEANVLTVAATGLNTYSQSINPSFKPSTAFAAASIMYIGGYVNSVTAPYSFGSSTRVKRNAGTPVDDLPSEVKLLGGGFRGVMRDARTVGNVRLLLKSGTAVPGKTQAPVVEVGVQVGAKTENVCSISTPCLNNGTCTNVFFNAYSCKCQSGWRGITCKYIDYCNTTTTHCPTGYRCSNAVEQPYYECSGSISLTTTSPPISLTPTGMSTGVSVSEVSIRMRTRTAATLTLLSLLNAAGSEEGKIELLNNGFIRASRKTGSSTPLIVNSTFKVNTGSWIIFGVNYHAGKVAIALTTTTASFKTVVDDGLGLKAVTKATLTPNKNYKGCFSAIHVNGFPFALHTNFTSTSVEGGRPKWRPTLSTTITTLLESNKGVCQQDPVCNPSPCLNSGKCWNLWNAYQCNCTTEFSGTNCSNPVCASSPALQNHSACLNSGQCVASAANFTCQCATNYIGSRCANLNPCLSSPCKNGATCTPVISSGDVSVVSSKCNCTNGWTGSYCETGTKGAAINYVLIFSIVGVILVLAIIIFVILIVRHIRTARSTRGIYDPHAQEMNGSHVYMANVIKPPPSERLI